MSIDKFIEEIKEYEIKDENSQIYNNSLTIEDAIDILERFEVAMINELTCEELEKLKIEKYGH